MSMRPSYWCVRCGARYPRAAIRCLTCGLQLPRTEGEAVPSISRVQKDATRTPTPDERRNESPATNVVLLRRPERAPADAPKDRDPPPDSAA